MSNPRIIKGTVELSDKVFRGVEKLRRNLEDFYRRNGMLDEIGQALAERTRERFRTERGPNGARWKPLAKETLRQKLNQRILVESGELHGSIHHEIHGDTVSIGTNLEYASPHQFGGEIEIPGRTQTNWHRTKGPKKGQFVSGKAKLKSKLAKVVQIPPHKVRIPARPFLGLSDEDKELVQEIVQRHLERAMKDALRS